MIDSVQQVVQSASMIPIDKIVSACFGIGVGASIGAKIIWKYIATPKHCAQHDELYQNVLVTKTNVEWLVSDYKRRNSI